MARSLLIWLQQLLQYLDIKRVWICHSDIVDDWIVLWRHPVSLAKGYRRFEWS